MAQLNNCKHCGSKTEFVVAKTAVGENVFAGCTNCKIQTQSVSSSPAYSAMGKVADVWNAAGQDEWPKGVQPLATHDAYFKGAKATYNGKNWISNIDLNVWKPDVNGWTAYNGGTT